MDDFFPQVNKAKIAYFTGTGSTALVADCLGRELESRGIETLQTSIKAGDAYRNDSEEMLFLLFAVHACNAPKPVYDWIKTMSNTKNGLPVVILSVSGGGEVSPNTACRLSCIKRLNQKDCNTIFDKMLVMPSNWVIPTIDELAVQLIRILPLKVKNIVDCVLSRKTYRSKPKIIDRFFSKIGEFEKLGAHYFGKNIKTDSTCNGCGICARDCPGRNIEMKDGRPNFGNACLLCLNCIYKCPNKALEASVAKFVVIRQGYDIEAMMKRMDGVKLPPLEEMKKSYLWKGVLDYLLEDCAK